MGEQDEMGGAKRRVHKPLRKPDAAAVAAADTRWRQDVSEVMKKDWFEILIVVEGVDPTTSSTVHARQSYLFEDIVWDHTFVPMFDLQPENRKANLDFTKINTLTSAPPE